MRVRLLGPVDVITGGRPQLVGGLRRRTVLAVLGVSSGEVVSSDRLIDLVWGDRPPATALNTLQRHVSHLRALLGDRDAIVARPPGYLLNLGADGTDLQVAARLVEEGRRADDPARKVARLRAALGLWRGRPFADLARSAWLDDQADRLDTLRVQVMEAIVEGRLALGEHAELVPELDELARQHPYREHLHGQLMVALYRAGRQADALAVYQRLRQDLADNLGIDPGSAVRDLEAAILRHDRTLDSPPPRAVTIVDRSVPHQLPADIAGFTGRADYLADLDAFLDVAGESPAVVISAISGTAGVGKTALAVHWARRVSDRFPDGQLYVNLRGFEPGGRAMASAEAVRRFLDALGVPAHLIPADLDAQAALYRTTLAGRRVLIVLDNARDAAQVRPLLPGAPTCLVVVTSRADLSGLVVEGAHPIKLDLPTAAEARELLLRRIGADRIGREPEAVEEMINRCARLPLALAVVAARATTHPRLPLRALAAELRDADARLDVLAGDDPTSDVRAVFSWSYRALTPDAARLFRLLGLPPGPDLSASAAASLAGLPPARVRSLLDELSWANLLVQHAGRRYTCHDLLRAYAIDLARQVDPDGDRRAATRRLLDHYLHTAYAADRLTYPTRDPLSIVAAQPGVTPETFADQGQALAWFTANHRVLLAAVDHAAATGFDGHAWQLAWTLVTFLNRQGHWHDLEATGRTALAAGVRLADAHAQAQAHCMRAYAQTRLGHFEQADAALRSALDLYGRLWLDTDGAAGCRDGALAGQAHARLNLAYVWERRGNQTKALDHSQQALGLYRAAGHRRGQGIALNAIGWCHALLGEHEQARTCCQQALPLLVEIGDHNGLADTWDSLGYAHHHLGDHLSAVGCYQHALELFRQLGDHYREAATFINLGDTHHAAGGSGAARRAWRQALAILADLDHPDAAVVRARLAALDAVPAGHQATAGAR